jgi:hypothetical protein
MFVCVGTDVSVERLADVTDVLGSQTVIVPVESTVPEILRL